LIPQKQGLFVIDKVIKDELANSNNKVKDNYIAGKLNAMINHLLMSIHRGLFNLGRLETIKSLF